MIPIQCPRCGRTGNVPPDRLNARLSCKGCHSVFHLDMGGRMVLGEPGSSKPSKTNYKASMPTVDFDLAQTWQDIPKPAKFGVPAVLVVLAGWMWFPSMSSSLTYVDQAQVVALALVNGDRSTVVANATADTAEAAGQWYDTLHTSIAEKGAGAVNSEAVQAALLDGNPEHDSSVNMGVVVLTDTVSTNFNLQMVKSGGSWKFDGAKSLAEAEKATASLKRAVKRK